jgi:hypothetical protein
MKKHYFVINQSEKGKNIAVVIRATESENLLSVLNIKNIITANICETKKAAEELAAFWNECYKENGTYLFG